jgi:hypothetical protein
MHSQMTFLHILFFEALDYLRMPDLMRWYLQAQPFRLSKGYANTAKIMIKPPQ